MTRRAFTLLEVLVALAVLAMLSGAVVGLLSAVVDGRARVSARAERTAAVDRVMRAIEDDVVNAVAWAGARGSGLRVEPGSLSVVRPVAGAAGLASGGPPTGWRATSVRWDAASGALVSGERGAGGEGAGGEGGGAARVVLPGVAAFRVRCLDGRTWRESFDSGALGRLPRAVEVAIWLTPAGQADAARVRADAANERDAAADAADAVGAADAGDAMERPADRRRVIAVPDGGEGEGGAEVAATARGARTAAADGGGA